MKVYAQCRERDGFFERKAELVPATPERIWHIYDRIKAVPNFITANFESITPESMRWLMRDDVGLMEVDDVGVIVFKLLPDKVAEVHITFWDRKMRGRDLLCRRVANQLIFDFKLKWIYTVIPYKSKAVIAFARRIGFQVMKSDEDRVVMVYPLISQ